MSLTRRQLIQRLGMAGGVSAAYLGMEALGLLQAPAAAAEPFELPRAPAGRPSVVILGAGSAGLVAAYELRRAGWHATVIEARDRVGGRAWTVRGGDRVEQMGRPDQICAFSKGMYLNAGAARIPSSHHTILGYAKRLGVPLEVMVNANRSSRWDFGGRTITNREAVNDTRGRIAELLVKAVGKGSLDQELSAVDKSVMINFLGAYGGLSRPNGEYKGDGRSGFSVLPGAYGETGTTLPPMKLEDILKERGYVLPLLFEEIFDQQAPMFQPVGGMDRIAHAIYEQVKPAVRLRTEVTAIRRIGERVRIEHGRGRATEADYCICTLPVNILARIPNDFSAAKQAAMKGTSYIPAVKVAFESRRFWEEDGVYGGVGWTDAMSENLLYPSGNWHGDKGVLVAAYVAGWIAQDNPQKFTALSHQERFRIAREAVGRLHPGKAAELTKPVTVAWGLTRYSEGVGPGDEFWFQSPRPARYEELYKPEGPIFFAGEHLSYVQFWQEGAALSSQAAMKALHARVQEKALSASAGRRPATA
jgi:monoamine oxidase